MKSIRTLEDIKARCYVNPDTGCWEWRMSKTAWGTAKVNYYDPDIGKKTASTGRRAALHLQTGRNPENMRAVSKMTCHARHCANPDHSRYVSESEYGKWLSRMGVCSTVSHDVARRLNGRSRAKLSMEKAREIRNSPLSSSALAEKYGVCSSLIRAIRCGKRWAESIPNASVFAWRPAA